MIIAGLVTLRQPSQPNATERQERATYIAALSHSATVALIGIGATGVIAVWRGLWNPASAIGHPYTTILAVKLLLFACAAVLGASNRFLVMPRMMPALGGDLVGGNGAERRFAIILQVEAVVLAFVLVLAAILSSTSPPTGG